MSSSKRVGRDRAKRTPKRGPLWRNSAYSGPDRRQVEDEAGQLGKISRRMADAGVNIEVMYSDHANQLILIVDDMETGRRVSEAWKS